jgi:hypothetical protein
VSVASTSVVQVCGTDPLPAAWPQLQVRALFRPPGFTLTPALTPALARAAASDSVRQWLHEQAGPALAADALQRPRHLRGAQAVSISHDANVSLVAWCTAGAVGIDLVLLDSLAQASVQELVATARLYLGPEAAQDVAEEEQFSAAKTCFALHWASMEARLKCLGLALDEWCSARAQSLAPVGSVRVQALDASGQPCTRWVGCVAWRNS